MRSIVSAIMVALALAMNGCQHAASLPVAADTGEPVPYITFEEFAATLADEMDVVLVEFCVPHGCFRCDEMRKQVDQLASDDRLTIRRVNLSQQPGLAWEFGVKVCPSYIAFRNREEVFRAAYPTSADLIAAGIDQALRNSSAEQLSVIDK